MNANINNIAQTVENIFNKLKITKTFYVVFLLFYGSFYYCDLVAKKLMPFLFNSENASFDNKTLEFLSKLEGIHYFIILAVIYSVSKMIDFVIELVKKIRSFVKSFVKESKKMLKMKCQKKEIFQKITEDIKLLKSLYDKNGYEHHGSDAYIKKKYEWKFVVFGKKSDDSYGYLVFDQECAILPFDLPYGKKPLISSEFTRPRSFECGGMLFGSGECLFTNQSFGRSDDIEINENFPLHESIYNYTAEMIFDVITEREFIPKTCIFFDYETFKAEFDHCLIEYVSKYTDLNKI